MPRRLLQRQAVKVRTQKAESRPYPKSHQTTPRPRRRSRERMARCLTRPPPAVSCSRSLKFYFDRSIPEGETAASWLREILTTLMRSEGPGTKALNQQVATKPRWAPDDAVAHGQDALRSRISSFLWNAICQRAKEENAPDTASWLRIGVYRAVLNTDWRSPPDPPPDPAVPTVPNFYEWYDDDDEALRRTLEFIERAQPPIQERWRSMRPAGAPRPRNLEEWKAVDQMSRLESIWQQWSAADPEGVHTLWKLGQLYQEMHRAEQAYARVWDHLIEQGKDTNKAHKRAEQDCLLWESKEALDRRPLKAAERKPA